MPLVQTKFQDVYGPQGFQVLGIHVGKEVYNAVSSAVNTGVQFPTLVDIDGSSLVDYGRYGEGVVVFPLGYVIDREGIIQAVYTAEEPDYDNDLIPLLESLLAQ